MGVYTLSCPICYLVGRRLHINSGIEVPIFNKAGNIEASGQPGIEFVPGIDNVSDCPVKAFL